MNHYKYIAAVVVAVVVGVRPAATDQWKAYTAEPVLAPTPESVH